MSIGLCHKDTSLPNGKSYSLTQVFWLSGDSDRPCQFYIGSVVRGQYSDAVLLDAYESAVDCFSEGRTDGVVQKIIADRSGFNGVVQRCLTAV